MAPQRPPSSPTSLLWAHQLKREHGFLLERMKRLETEIAGVETRTREAQDTAGVNEIAAIAKKVQSLADDGGRAAMEKIREEVMERFEDVGAEIEAVTIQVSNLGHSDEALKEDRRRALENEKALLRRIKDVEGNMKEYERVLLKLGKKIDEQAVDQIREALKELTEDVKSEKIGLELVQSSIEKLDEASKMLRESSERIAEQVKELAERPVPTPAPAHVQPIEEAERLPAVPEPPKKAKAPKKTTAKPASKAAPKQAATALQPALVRGVATVKQTTTASQQRVIDAELNKPIVRRGRGWIEVEDDSTEDEDEQKAEDSAIDEPTDPRSRLRKAVIPPPSIYPAAPTAPPLKRGPGRPKKDAVRPSQDTTSTASAPPVKRGPGRPRKDASQAAPAPQRSIIQPDENPPPPKKSHKKLPVGSQVVYGATKTSVKPELSEKFVFDSPEPPQKKQRRGLTNIFTSPMSSSIAETVESSPGLVRPGGVFDSDTNQPALRPAENNIQAQLPKRRMIVQPDEATILRNLQEDVAF